MTERPPSLLVVAGPNGSGKTTLTRALAASGHDLGHHINPDDIAATLTGPYDERVRAAQTIAEFERDRCLLDDLDFSFETVMSHPGKLDFLRRARMRGYLVNLFFVGTSDPGINLSRVADRVELGGHDVPPDKIVSRYRRTMGLLCRACFEVQRAVVFDNSAVGFDPAADDAGGRLGLRPVVEMLSRAEGISVGLEPPVPRWVETHLLEPLRRADRAFRDRHGVSAIHIARRGAVT